VKNMDGDPFDLTGKVALVTGGSRGLGLQMVRAFARKGADVVIASRKLDACEAAAEEVRALGRRALAFSVHAAKWDQMDALSEAAYAEFGRIDILVNNAGMSPAVPSHEVTEQLFDSVVGLNFKGPFRLATQVAHRMSQGDGGVIINISSIASLMPTPGVTPYSGAKAALNAMTVSLAHEYAPKVRVNCIAAGPFLTDRSKIELRNQSAKAPGIISRAGIKTAIMTDHPVTPVQYLPLCAAVAVKEGMDEEEALRAITINAAEITGIADCVGSLEIGKDADIIIMDGYPLELKSKVLCTIINGQVVKRL
jgi:NAD(P)-dependent dehydrogenase (short-subunit alcohol dehydrogenase family)